MSKQFSLSFSAMGKIKVAEVIEADNMVELVGKFCLLIARYMQQYEEYMERKLNAWKDDDIPF